MELIKRLKWGKVIVAICIMIGITAIKQPIPAFAGAFGITNEFDNLGGDGKYLGEKYRDNYQLDMEKVGLKDAGYGLLNEISNGIFSAITFVALACISVFYYVLDFNIAALLEPLINQVQESLRLNVFLPIFQIALVGAFILAIVRFARRDFAGLMGQFGKVIFVLLVSILLVNDSATFLSYTSNITKGLSVQIMTGVSGVDIQNETNKYAAEAAGTLWVSLVHEPWKSLEFAGYDYTAADEEFFLTETDKELRLEKIKEIRETSPKAFSKEAAGRRIGEGAIMFITMLIKCIVYIIVSIILLLFQVFTILLVLMGPIILILSLMPGYDFTILGIWCRKLLETQVGILVITFLMGIMVLMDRLIQGMSQVFGWYVALILQGGMCFGIYYFRYELIGMLAMATIMVSNQRRLRQGLVSGGVTPYQMMYMMQLNRQANGRRGGFRRNQPLRQYEPQEENESTIYRRKYKEEEWDREARPSTYHSSPTRPMVKRSTVYQEREPESVDTGIKSISYYAPSEVTSNWREMWENAEKPGRPQMKEEISRRKTKTTEAAGIKSVSYYAPGEVTSNWREMWENAEKPGRPQMKEEISRRKTKTTEAGGREAATAPQSRPVSHEAAPGGREAATAPQSRPVSHEAAPGGREAATASQSRPVSHEAAPGGREAATASQSRPVSHEAAPGGREAATAPQSRPVSHEAAPGGRGPATAPQSRSVSHEAAPGGQEPATAPQSRPVSHEAAPGGREPVAAPQSRPVSHEAAPGGRGPATAPQSRPVSHETAPGGREPATALQSRPVSHEAAPGGREPAAAPQSRPVSHEAAPGEREPVEHYK